MPAQEGENKAIRSCFASEKAWVLMESPEITDVSGFSILLGILGPKPCLLKRFQLMDSGEGTGRWGKAPCWFLGPVPPLCTHTSSAFSSELSPRNPKLLSINSSQQYNLLLRCRHFTFPPCHHVALKTFLVEAQAYSPEHSSISVTVFHHKEHLKYNRKWVNMNRQS